MRYRVKMPFLTVVRDGCGKVAFTAFSTGSVIEVHRAVQKSGLVDVLHEGEIVATFMRDIEERTERIEETSA